MRYSQQSMKDLESEIPWMRSYAMSLTNPDDAEDVVMDVYLRLKGNSSYNPRIKGHKHYLARCLKRAAFDRKRSRYMKTGGAYDWNRPKDLHLSDDVSAPDQWPIVDTRVWLDSITETFAEGELELLSEPITDLSKERREPRGTTSAKKQRLIKRLRRQHGNGI